MRHHALIPASRQPFRHAGAIQEGEVDPVGGKRAYEESPWLLRSLRVNPRVIELARSTGRTDVVLDGLLSRMGHAFVTGRFADADAFAGEIGRFAAAAGSDLATVCFRLGAGIAAYYLGRLHDSDRDFAAAVGTQVLQSGGAGIELAGGRLNVRFPAT